MHDRKQGEKQGQKQEQSGESVVVLVLFVFETKGNLRCRYLDFTIVRFQEKWYGIQPYATWAVEN